MRSAYHCVEGVGQRRSRVGEDVVPQRMPPTPASIGDLHREGTGHGPQLGECGREQG